MNKNQRRRFAPQFKRELIESFRTNKISETELKKKYGLTKTDLTRFEMQLLQKTKQLGIQALPSEPHMTRMSSNLELPHNSDDIFNVLIDLKSRLDEMSNDVNRVLYTINNKQRLNKPDNTSKERLFR